jgi:glucose/mannose-6-phosphate isomerase
LITATDIDTIDQSQICLIYEKWPEHFKRARGLKCKMDHSPDFYESIVLCGMGGSATACDIVSDTVRAFSDVPSLVLRGQRVPPFVGKHSLVIVNSVSGNTEEAIAMMLEATKQNAEVICISTGGRLKELAGSYGKRHIEIPNFTLPRASLPYLVMPGLTLVNPFIKKNSLTEEMDEIPSRLSSIAENICKGASEESNTAKKIARFLENGFVFCFSSPSLTTAGIRFKNSLNENAKMHCLAESVLEATHNEIVPFTYDNDPRCKVVLLKWEGDPPIVKKRFAKISRLFAETNHPAIEITSLEKGLLNAIICSIYILDYATIYRAISSGLDPSPTPAIEILKETNSIKDRFVIDIA